MKYPEKIAMVVTHPLFASHAERLARDFGKVYLHIPWNSHSFPTLNCGRVGEGLGNVTKIDSMWGKELDECDLIYFPDIYFPAEQVRLEEMGFNVWGGRNGEEIELWRDTCKEVMEGVGLPTQPWKKIKGITQLREHLKENENQHVKISKWRGSFETFRAETYELVESKLDEMAVKLGCFKEEVDLIVENDLPDCVEIGTDTYCIDGEYPSSTLVGIEVKDLGFCGQFVKWSDIAEPITRWNTSMAPVFRRYGYRGWLSNEIRIGEDLIPYCIDPTCRAPSPPGELLQEFYTNYAEIIWEGSQGRVVDPIPAAKFGVQIIMKSAFAVEHSLHIEFDPQYANQIKIYNPAVVDGKHYCVPQDEQMEECGCIIGWGDTLQAAINHMEKAADTVKAYGVKIPKGSVQEAEEQMEALAKLGISPFKIDKAKE